MRSFLVRLFCFCVLLVLAHVALIGLATLANPALQSTIARNSNVPLGLPLDNAALRFDEVANLRDIDVLFIGSSHSLRTFDPRYFSRHGIRAFNLGTANQTPLNTYYLLRQYLPRLNPRLVVMEAYWETLAINGVEGTIYITGNRGPNLTTLQMALATRDALALNAQISSQFGRMLGRMSESRLHPAEVYTSGGFLERWDPNIAIDLKRSPRVLSIDEQQLGYLSSVLTLLSDRGVKTLLTWAPVTRAHRGATANLDDIRRLVTELSEAHRVPFVDLADRVVLDDYFDFKDADHLNQRGVNKVMPVLVDVLKEHQLLGRDELQQLSEDNGRSTSN